MHNFAVGPGLGEGAHIFQVSGRESGHLWEGSAEILRQPIDDLGAPTLSLLSAENVPTDGPVQEDELPIDRKAGPVPCRCDFLFQIADKGRVALQVDLDGRLTSLNAAMGLGWCRTHAAIFTCFLASMARTNLSHFIMPARFSAM